MGEIPANLDDLEPGLLLSLFLDTAEDVDPSGFDRVVLLRAHQKMASYYQARVYEDMAALFELTQKEEEVSFEEAFANAEAEIGAALHLTRRAAASELALALDLTRRLPPVLQALARGDLDLRRAKVMVYGTAHLPEDTARRVVDEAIDRAAHLTSGQLYTLLRKLCIQADPEEAERRYQETVADRRVVYEASLDGTANLLGLDLPPHLAAEAIRRINHLARSLKTAGEERTMDQLRADVLLDLLNGHHRQQPSGRGTIDLQVDLTTLAGLDDHPGELAGFGPVIADIARQVTEQQQRSEWRWTLTHPQTGQVMGNGTTRRRPTSSQRRQVEARNNTCIFPGCRMPARNCDLDHRIPWAQGGPTQVDHLDPLCRHHHVVRHRCGWQHQPLPNGDHLWTSPLGHQYTRSGQPP
ncbi:MAG: DUF222 domain-containing protein [Acidimicrobiia bacterium]|nr:DUF222 domain-containing protein [Acidimicrobiia bacterium]